MPGFESGHEGPKYIAFRLSENGGYLAVMAALDPDDTVRFPWATWYHEHAPQGKYQKAPADYARLFISPERAIAMVDLIRARRALPPDFVATLPIVY
jgi:hypothetical protein